MIEWIKTSERLPEDRQKVLVTVKENSDIIDGASDKRTVWQATFHEDEGETTIGFWKGKRHKLYSVNYFDIWKMAIVPTTCVLAWSPLPEPYNG